MLQFTDGNTRLALELEAEQRESRAKLWPQTGSPTGVRQPTCPHPVTTHAIREACDNSPLVTERPSRAESPWSPAAQQNKGEGMAADCLLCPARAKPDLTGREGLRGEMDVAEESLTSFLQGRRPGSRCWAASC